MDETYIGGEEPGLRGGRARGKKSLVGVEVELREPRGYGRRRMKILTDASAATLHPFVTEHVEPGTRIITDGWLGYRGIDKLGYTHEPRSQRAARARGDDRLDWREPSNAGTLMYRRPRQRSCRVDSEAESCN